MKFTLSFKYQAATFTNQQTGESVRYETKAADGAAFVHDNIDEDAAMAVLKGVRDRRANLVLSDPEVKADFINQIAKSKCKELYDKMDKEGWTVEQTRVSDLTMKDLELLKPTMNARETFTVESGKVRWKSL